MSLWQDRISHRAPAQSACQKFVIFVPENYPQSHASVVPNTIGCILTLRVDAAPQPEPGAPAAALVDSERDAAWQPGLPAAQVQENQFKVRFRRKWRLSMYSPFQPKGVAIMNATLQQIPSTDVIMSRINPLWHANEQRFECDQNQAKTCQSGHQPCSANVESVVFLRRIFTASCVSGFVLAINAGRKAADFMGLLSVN